MQNYLAAVTPYLTKDNAIRIALVGVGIVLLIIAGSKLVPNHSVRSLFGHPASAIVERAERPAKVVKPAQVAKAKPAKRVKRKVAPKAKPVPAPEPQGWTRECDINNWCNWVYYP